MEFILRFRLQEVCGRFSITQWVDSSIPDEFTLETNLLEFNSEDWFIGWGYLLMKVLLSSHLNISTSVISLSGPFLFLFIGSNINRKTLSIFSIHFALKKPFEYLIWYFYFKYKKVT
jgi:hypothetical protein